MTNRFGLSRTDGHWAVQGRGQCYKCTVEKKHERLRGSIDRRYPRCAHERDRAARSICIEAVREGEMDGPGLEIY